MERTAYCGQITSKYKEQHVTITGWVQKRRDLGGMIFIDLRDRFGIVQVVFNSDKNKEALEIAEKIRSEFIISVQGQVIPRAQGQENNELNTGEIEIMAEKVEILSEAKTPAFEISDTADISDDVRLKYRYLDLRRPKMQENLKLRHQV
ncbi:MAG: OB-fold nucleic acid binding domain-containing protein, partial [Lactococcus lactis]|nr:OB-fold nucleic acid binding domain-containing protein [Lactococcus lactis]